MFVGKEIEGETMKKNRLEVDLQFNANEIQFPRQNLLLTQEERKLLKKSIGSKMLNFSYSGLHHPLTWIETTRGIS